MTIRIRQGWRVLIVLSRLAVAGLLLFAPPLLESNRVFAQSEAAPGSPPPPPRTQSSHSDAPSHQTPKHSELAAHPDRKSEPTPATAATDRAAITISLPTQQLLERVTARRISLNQILYRDRRHRLLLLRGDAALSHGNSQVALANLQALLDATEDAFLWPSESTQPRGAQFTADSRLEALPDHLREDYERLHGEEARVLLKEAAESGEGRHLVELIRRFSRTDAGRTALTREFLLAVDTAQSNAAEDLARRLAADAYQWRQLSPPMKRCVKRVLDQCVDTPAHSQDQKAISPPALTPIWMFAYSDGLDLSRSTTEGVAESNGLRDTVAGAIQDWLDDRHERRFPVATASQALPVGDVLVMRDFTGIRALHLKRSDTLWTYRCRGSLAATANDGLQAEARGTGAPPVNFQAHFAGYGPRGQLTTDGRLVFFLDNNADQVETEDANAISDSRPLTNRIVALPLRPPSDEIVPEWVKGDTDSLEGAFFLGPPLAINDRVFALSECGGRIDCLALDASDGALLWRQPIALTEQTVEWDLTRQRIACTPLVAGSVIVCPTEVGVVVGVDSMTGLLRWVYDHIDEDQRLAAGRWSSSSQRNFGSCELPSRTLLHQGRIYHLPFRSRHVHCIDAATGAEVWKADRAGALALSSVTDDAVILIGPRDLAARSPRDGSLLWKTSCPEAAGHGLVAAGQYLLPTADGRCLPVALDAGSISGTRYFAMLQSSRPAGGRETADIPEIPVDSNARSTDAERGPTPPAGGNLLAAGDSIVVTAPTHVAVIPQAQALLDSLLESDSPLTEADRLRSAMLHLLLEDRAAARVELQGLTTSSQDLSVREPAAQLLREILFSDLEDTAAPAPILRQLERLASSDNDRLRLLVASIDVAAKENDGEALVKTLTALRHFDLYCRIHPEGDEDYAVRAIDHVADRLSLLRSSSQSELIRVISDHVTSEAAKAAAGDPVAQAQLIAAFDAWPQMAHLRNEVASRLIGEGKLQQAELLLLKNRDTVWGAASAFACLHLTDLYVSQGMSREASVHLGRLTERLDNGDLDVGTAEIVRKFVNELPVEHPAVQLIHHVELPMYGLSRVTINEHLCDDACERAVTCRSTLALEHHDRIRRKFLTSRDSSLTVIDRGIVSADRSQSRLSLVNRESGVLHGEIDVPAAYWQLAGGGEGHCGQLLPVCGRAAHGLSLLEQRPVWSWPDQTAPESREKVKVGPIGHDYCVLQTTRRLSVVDPSSGEVRWTRDQLPPNVGLMANESTGIIGDAESLVLFDADQRNYTIYRMRSGKPVRTGQIDVEAGDARRFRRAAGDRLVHVIGDDEGQRLRVWDAADDQLVLDEPLHDKLFCHVSGNDRYAYVSPTLELRLVNVLTGVSELNLQLDESLLQSISDIRVAEGPDGHFINLLHCDSDSADDAVAATDEVELPSLRVQGELMSVSRSGRILWSQQVPDSAMLMPSEYSLPVLMLFSRVRDPQHRQSATLRLTVLDARTGETLARREDLLRTRIVQADDQPHDGRLSLIGLDSLIEIDFGRPQHEWLIHAEANETPALVR